MRRALAVAAVVAALSTPLGPAVADDTVVVPGLAFPSSDTYLTYFGCQDLYHADTRGPQVRIGKGEGAVPAGTRAFGLRMPGAGTAAGPVRQVASVAGTTVAGFSARAAQGGSGVAYVWYVAPGLLPGQAWAGRADLAAGPVWQVVDTTAATYTWTLYEAATGAVLEDGGAHTIADFTAARGDGPGYLLAGFGCDGGAFALDALRYGAPGAVTTYDLEGVPVATSIGASERAPSGEVTVSGATVAASGAPMGSTLVLEARVLGAEEFETVGTPVLPAADGSVSTVVSPLVTTDYRWFLPETGYADAGYSPVVRVEVPKAAR